MDGNSRNDGLVFSQIAVRTEDEADIFIANIFSIK